MPGGVHRSGARIQGFQEVHPSIFPQNPRIIIINIIITPFFCLEARCVCRQAAAKAAKILPLVGLARSKQDPINRGHGAQYFCRHPPAGANTRMTLNYKGN